jgi:AraC family transcriptional regulator
MIASRGHPVLPFGAFYGSVDRRLRAPGLEVAVLSADPHRIVERHSHDDAHFVFVLDGLYISSAAGAVPVSAGPALIFNPAGTTHRDRFEARDRVMTGRFLTLSIGSDMIDAARQDAGETTPRAVALTSVHAHSLAHRLATVSDDHVDDALQRESLALALLSEVTATRPAPHRSAPGWLSVACEQLDDALGSDIRIADIAREAGVHPVHLARMFRLSTGVTPGDYLRQRRLAHACTLLRESRRPLSDIALTCGFVDQSHFATAFRRAYRVTPSAYRLQH